MLIRFGRALSSPAKDVPHWGDAQGHGYGRPPVEEPSRLDRTYILIIYKLPPFVKGGGRRRTAAHALAAAQARAAARARLHPERSVARPEASAAGWKTLSSGRAA